MWCAVCALSLEHKPDNSSPRTSNHTIYCWCHRWCLSASKQYQYNLNAESISELYSQVL